MEHVAARLFHSVPYLFGHTARFLWFKNICPCHFPSKFMLLIAQIYFKTSSNAHMWLNGCHLSQVIPSNSRAGLVLDFKTLRMTLGLFAMSLLLASAQYRSWYGESTIHKYTIWPYFREKKPTKYHFNSSLWLFKCEQKTPKPLHDKPIFTFAFANEWLTCRMIVNQFEKMFLLSFCSFFLFFSFFCSQYLVGNDVWMTKWLYVRKREEIMSISDILKLVNVLFKLFLPFSRHIVANTISTSIILFNN